jgi:hypothetical protein
MGDHGLDRISSAEGFGSLGMPGGALLGQGTGFVCRRPTMITLKPTRQRTLPHLDQHPPRRPPFIRDRVNADNLPHRPLTRLSVSPIREPHTQPVVEVVFKGGVVGFRGGHGRFE